MTYNEWRDELKSNLLCVSETERRRVLDYYAEAYADRRDAGFSEREIIDDFGAPYDAAQRILNESAEDYVEPPKKEARRDNRLNENRRPYKDDIYGDDYSQKREAPRREPVVQKQSGRDYTWVFVLLCVIFAVPLFSLIVTMISLTICFAVVPMRLLITGVAAIGSGVGALFVDVAYGAGVIGVGIMIFGISLMLMPLFFKLIDLMWTVFKKVFSWLKRLFSGKERI